MDIQPAQLEALQDATVAMVEPQGTHYRAFCSGVWIGDDTIVTAAHCVEPRDLTPVEEVLNQILGLAPEMLGREVFYASFQDLAGKSEGDDIGRASVAVVVAVDAAHDVAVIRVREAAPQHHIAPLASRTMSPGEVGHIVGHPGGELYSYTPAHVAAVRQVEAPYGKTDMLQVWSGAWHGNSGGGLFDAGGELQGICSLVMEGSSNGFFVHVRYVRKLVEGL